MQTPTNLRRWTDALVPNPLGLFARLRSNRFVRSVGILSSGAAIGHAFTLAAAPILTRIYGPSDFGALGLFTSFLSVMGVAVGLRYEFSIVSSKDECEAAYLMMASLLFALPVSALAGGILWGLIHFSALGSRELPRQSPLLFAFAMCFIGCFGAMRYWCLREARFHQVSQGVVAQSAGRALFQTAIGSAGLHSVGLLLGETIGRGMGMSRMLRSSWPVIRRCVTVFRWEEMRHALWRNRKFPFYSLPSSLLDALCLNLSVPLLIRMYGAAVGGHYSLVWKAIAVPSVLVTLAVADTFHSHLAACARETPGRVLGLFRTTSLTLLLVGSIPAATLWFWGEPLFRAVFGAQWALSGSIAAIIAPWYLADFVVSPVSRVVVVLNGQEMKLVWDVLGLASLLTVFFVAQRHSMPPLLTIRILTVVNTLLHAVYYVILMNIIHRFNGLPNARIQVA